MKRRQGRRDRTDPLIAVLKSYRQPMRTDFADAWVGMEPTFQTKKSVRKWAKYSKTPEGEVDYFGDEYMLATQKKVAKKIQKKYEAARAAADPSCVFAAVEVEADEDPWQVRRQNLRFHWDDRDLEPFEVRFGLDPETFEFSIKPVPLVWFYDPRFVAFLEEYVWAVPHDLGLSSSIAHGGAQFSFSAKTFLGGSLLADVIAAKLNHPELALWTLDWPNCDDRSFRATRERFQSFRDVLDQYWAGSFHPRAVGTLTVENAYLDRGFEPAAAPRARVMGHRGPLGDSREVFQNNFAFGRAVRLRAQDVHPGYWQSAHPDEDGYRPDQIMRYSEGNLNRLQIAGEYHVKSGKVLDPEHVVDLDTPLHIGLLYEECSWENRGQMGRTSARDFVEALLLDAHHAQYLQRHPRPKVVASLLQDQLMIEGEKTLRKHGPRTLLARLHKEARKSNLEASRQRIVSDWIEPETLFYAAWKALPEKAKAAVAREVVTHFVEYVEQAASVDPRRKAERSEAAQEDPMEWHRHRVHPVLWAALESERRAPKRKDVARRELERWQANRKRYLSRRPPFSLTGVKEPWKS